MAANFNFNSVSSATSTPSLAAAKTTTETATALTNTFTTITATSRMSAPPPPFVSSRSTRHSLESCPATPQPHIRNQQQQPQYRTSMSYKPSDLAALIPPPAPDRDEQPQVKQNYEDLVSCTVCYDQFDGSNALKHPKILPCQHTFCVECIRNLIHCSTSESTTTTAGFFHCPQCKYRVEKVRDAATLPTSRIVLSLLEKESLNYQGYASCPSCRQIRNLEVCFECNLPLCGQCVGKHYDAWKNEKASSSLRTEESLELYKNKIDKLSPLIAQNFEMVQAIKEDIDEAFAQIIQRLNTEKDVLMRALNEIKDDNAKFVNFKKEVAACIAGMRSFRESSGDAYERKLMNARVKKAHHNADTAQRLERTWNDELAHSSFKLLERFEKKFPSQSDLNISGNLVVKQVSLDSILATPTTPPSTPPSAKTSLAPSAPEPSPPSAQLTKWLQTSQLKPHSELTVAYTPTCMAAYGSLLFCLDGSTSALTVYERAFSAELKQRNATKLSVPNVRSMALNASYLVAGYVGLAKKEHLKGPFKGMPTTGVLLYRREQHVVCSMHEKSIELGGSAAFRSVSGLALSDKCVFVSDSDARAVYQLDIKTSALLRSFDMSTSAINGQPTSISCCIKQQRLCVLDALNASIHVLDADTMSLLGSTSHKDVMLVGQGGGTLLLSDDQVVFLRNSDVQMCAMDAVVATPSVSVRAFFNEIPQKMSAMALLADATATSSGGAQLLVIGTCGVAKMASKLYGYVASNQ